METSFVTSFERYCTSLIQVVSTNVSSIILNCETNSWIQNVQKLKWNNITVLDLCKALKYGIYMDK